MEASCGVPPPSQRSEVRVNIGQRSSIKMDSAAAALGAINPSTLTPALLRLYGRSTGSKPHSSARQYFISNVVVAYVTKVPLNEKWATWKIHRGLFMTSISAGLAALCCVLGLSIRGGEVWVELLHVSSLFSGELSRLRDAKPQKLQLKIVIIIEF